MRVNGVEAAIARYREAGTKKMRGIEIARKWGARTWGFYCIRYVILDVFTNLFNDY